MTLTTSISLLVPAALQAWLAVILVRRKLQRSFRFFFAYTVFSVAAGLAEFAAQGNYTSYFYTYWVAQAGYAVLGLLAILETFPHVFKAFSLVRSFRLVILAVAGLMVLLAVSHAVFISTAQAGPLTAVIYPLEIGVRYVQCGIFILFVAMAVFYGFPWPRYPFGIVFGFGLVATSQLAAALLRSEFGTRFKFMFTFMPGVVYVFAVLVWLLTFLGEEPPDPAEGIRSPLSPEEVIKRTRKLSSILKGRRDDNNLLASAFRGSTVPRLRCRQIPSRRAPADYH